jgi:hypothetical protein
MRRGDGQDMYAGEGYGVRIDTVGYCSWLVDAETGEDAEGRDQSWPSVERRREGEICLTPANEVRSPTPEEYRSVKSIQLSGKQEMHASRTIKKRDGINNVSKRGLAIAD